MSSGSVGRPQSQNSAVGYQHEISQKARVAKRERASRLFPTLPLARDQRQNVSRNPHLGSRRSSGVEDALATGVARALAHPRASTPRRRRRGIGFKPASPARAKSRRARATPRDAPRHVSERADAPLRVEPRAFRGSCSRRGPSRRLRPRRPVPSLRDTQGGMFFFFRRWGANPVGFEPEVVSCCRTTQCVSLARVVTSLRRRDGAALAHGRCAS